jgi:hypothetical protein
MLESNPQSPKARLSVGQKLVIAGLLCLQVPSSAVFYPVATVIILTGVGAPLSRALWAIGTMPFSLAMKRKAAWQSGGERSSENGRGTGVLADDTAAIVPPSGI